MTVKNGILRKKLTGFCGISLAALLFLTGPVRVQAASEDTLNSESAQTAEENGIEQAENSVVKIQSFFTDQDGNTYRIHTGSGFVVSKSSSETYIATSASNLPEENDITAYCEKNGLTVDLQNVSTSISVIISGDVKAEAELNENMYSQQENFCILTTSLLENRDQARLDDSGSLNIGDSVWNLGYDLHDGEEGVGLENGVIQNTRSVVGENTYIQTTARSVSHSTGGPLVDDNGYVIGMQDASLNVDGDETYYALPISEITEILKNFDLTWESRNRDTAREDLQKKTEEAQEMLDSGKYKDASAADLKTAVENAEAVLEEETPEVTELTDASDSLDRAESSLVEKTPKIRIATRIVLPALLGILFILLIRNLIVLSKLKKRTAPNNFRKVSEKNAGKQNRSSYQKPAAGQPFGQSYGRVNSDEELTRKMYGQEHGRQTEARLVFADGRKVKLECGWQEYRIGRKRDANDIVIDNRYVSREHAKIIGSGDRHFLINVSPNNITKVNGRNVPEGEKHLLNHNDRITLATEEIRYEIIRL